MGINSLPQQEFRVNLLAVITSVFFILVSIGTLLWIWIEFILGNETATLGTMIGLNIVSIFSIILFTWIFIIGIKKVVIDENGISSYFFGKLKLSIKWEELVDIKLNVNALAGAIRFSKSSLKGISVTRANFRRDNIALSLNDDFAKALKFYYGVHTARNGPDAIDEGHNSYYHLRVLTLEEREERLKEVAIAKEEASKYIATEEGLMIPNPNYKQTTSSTDDDTTS